MENAICVYKAIVDVQSSLAKEGIAKDKICTQGASYKFRGIDDIYNALAPFLASAGLCIIPRMLSRSCVERTSSKGNALFYTIVEAEFDFVSAEDGSKHTAKTYGEAMDSGDKGTNKAMSAAYKYAAFQTFCIPTEGDHDTENSTHEVKGYNKKTSSDFEKEADKHADSVDDLGKWYLAVKNEIAKMDEDEQIKINRYVTQLKNALATVECPESGKIVKCEECKGKRCFHGCPAYPAPAKSKLNIEV